jgi:hypothetical protein
VGSTLFFRADDGTHGQELWALPVSAAHQVYLPLVCRR